MWEEQDLVKFLAGLKASERLGGRRSSKRHASHSGMGSQDTKLTQCIEKFPSVIFKLLPLLTWLVT